MPAASLPISTLLSLRYGSAVSCAAIPMCWAGSASSVNKILPYAIPSVGFTSSGSAVCSTTWPTTAMTLPTISFVARAFLPPAHYLPNPLSPEDDSRLDQHLRHTDDLVSNVLLLI